MSICMTKLGVGQTCQTRCFGQAESKCCKGLNRCTRAGACRSDGVEQIALGDLEKDAELNELDTAMFSRAPIEAMQATLAYIRCPEV